MRVKTSTFHCPPYCFSKPLPPPRPPFPPPPSPPPTPLQYQPHALETEDSHRIPFRSSPGSLVEEEKLCDEKVEIDENSADGRKKEFFLKSSLKKTCGSPSKELVRECVKWMDDLGKELVEIREFEPIESGELDGEMYGYPNCACVIL